MRRDFAQDSCPGVLRPFVADDGAIVRVRVPGGRMTVGQLVGLSRLAREFGTGVVQLTSRGNLQVRGLAQEVPEAFVTGLDELGLLGSAAHDRVRNIVASPNAALDGLIAELDAALQADEALAGLPGRWLFVITDAHRVGLDAPYDVAFQVLADGTGRVLSGGRQWPCAPENAVATMLDKARQFLDARNDERQWQVRELDSDSAYFADGTPADDATTAPPVSFGPGEGVLTLGVPLGLLEPHTVDGLERALGDDVSLVVTHQRTLVVRSGMHVTGAMFETLRHDGFIVTNDDPRARVGACIGAPACRRTDVPTVDIAAAAADLVGDDEFLYVSGCERRCGHPQHDFYDVVAPSSVDDVAASLSQRSTHER